MTLHPFPSGWYAALFSDELARGEVKTLTLFGEELVAFRSEAGEAALVSAYCPHLGAHLGHGGTVVGESLRCPFHHFRFDRAGTCVHVPYGTKPPPAARLRTLPVEEKNGMVLAWHGASGEAPTFHVPALDGEGWTPLMHACWTLPSHPQDTSENSVDVAHFKTVHGFARADVRAGPFEEGPIFRIDYGAERPGQFMGRDGLPFDFDVTLYGLGVSVVDTRVPTFGVTTRQYVLATPLDGTHILLRGAMAMRRLPDARATELVFKNAFDAFVEGVVQDHPIWSHKRYVERPALAAGDGPIGQFRRWARQFYPRLDQGAAAA
jgi:nitrite reductase/ring-hydroxylating ferredoxin subunit